MRFLFAALLLLSHALPSLALPYSGIYFFGDSLSDVGNVQNTYAALTGGLGFPAAVPGAPYDSQGRFSNGPLYADVLAQGLGYTATPSTVGGNDFAYAGARTEYQPSGLPFLGLLDQVTDFRNRTGPADATALYVVWAGANNLQDLINGLSGPSIPDIGGTVHDIATAVLGLYAEGARTFLIPNTPDLGLVPRVREAGPGAQFGAHALSVAFNAALAQAMNQLENDPLYSGLDILSFDTFSALNDVVAHAGTYGLSNTTDRCYTGDDENFTGGGTVCAQPDSYLFWDGIHPTAAVHAILGRQMLATVPEPETPILVATALLALGFTARRQRQQR